MKSAYYKAVTGRERASPHDSFDNGKEFAYHAKIQEALGSDNYFAHPYHSWERGLNENHNGLIRQYLPKGMALDKAADEEVSLIQQQIQKVAQL